MNAYARIIAALTLAALAGCAPVPMKKLDAPMADAEKADHVVIFLEQSEIAVDDVDVQNGGTSLGLIGVLVGSIVESAMESTMTKNRQEAIAPLRDALLDYQYETRLIEAISSHLPTSLVKADAQFKLVRNQDEWRAHLDSVVPANVFLVNTRYAFEQNFDVAYVYAAATLQHFDRVPPSDSEWKKMSQKQRKANAPTLLHAGSYYSQHVTHSPFAKQKKDRKDARYEHNAAQWAVNGAEPVRQAFGQSLEEIAALIQRDGEGRLPPAPKKKDARVFLANFVMQPMLLKSSRVERTADRSLVMLGQNAYWIDNLQIKP
jgi:hypothetical protein